MPNKYLDSVQLGRLVTKIKSLISTTVAGYLPLSGGSINGNLSVSGTITGDVTGNADTATTATKATNDANGNPIASTYLPRTGGTMTGNVVVKTNSDENRIQIAGGNTSDGYTGGGRISIYGKAASGDYTGGIVLMVYDDTNGRKNLVSKPNGTLSWNGQPIQTSSDKNLKTDFSDVPADVLEAWGKVEWKQFKYIADAERKGANNCRWHTGLVAQDVKEVGEENNVNLLKYGILCHDVQEATEEHEAVDLWTIRYEEALAMEVVYLRNEIKKLREEINGLR